MPPKAKKPAAEETRKRKRAGGKAAKDPNEPKRPTTAFFFFAQDQRGKIKEENPDMKITEISKELGRLWKELSDKQKEKYTAMAVKDKGRYEKVYSILI